jgi:hypothetical protein
VEKDRDADQLRELSDQELVRTASREILIALIMCSRVLRERVSDLVSRKPMEISILISAMSQCLKAAVIGLLHGGELEPHPSFFRKGIASFFGSDHQMLASAFVCGVLAVFSSCP